MNIQIFGRNKCFDTKKAERYFKERRIKYQFIDLPRIGMSRRELESVRSAVGLDELIDPKAPDYDLIRYLRATPRGSSACWNIRTISALPWCGTGARPQWATGRRSGRPGSNIKSFIFPQVYAILYCHNSKEVVKWPRIISPVRPRRAA